MTLHPDHPFGVQINAAITAASAANPGGEICGVIRQKDGGPQFEEMPNEADDPAAHFVVTLEPPRKEADEAGDPEQGNVLAIVHSHPKGPAWPSADDLRQQQATALIWGICVPPPIADHGVFWFGPGITPPLFQRPYRHGVTDCYGFIRDFYQAEFDISLIDRPREWGWWEADASGPDFYLQNFVEAGFVQIAEKDGLQRGDVALARIRSAVINHALIWHENGCLLHHLAGRDGYHASRMPRMDPAERWGRHIVMWARHKAVPLSPQSPVS